MIQSSNRRLWWASIVAFACASGAAAWSAAARPNLLWDEAVDLRIAAGLMRNPLFGNEIVLDATQMRLSMYLTAAAMRLFGEDLMVGRLLACLAGAAAVALTGWAVAMWRGKVAGVAAAALMSLSPYWLSNCRLACTEGDVFAALGAAAVMVAAQVWLRRRDAVALVWLGLALLVTVGAKLYGLIVVVTVLAILLGKAQTAQPGRAPAARSSLRPAATLAGLVLSIGLLGSAASLAASRVVMVGLWGLLLAAWLALLVAVISAKVVPERAWTAGLLLAAISLGGVLATMPQHMTRPDAAKDIARRFLRWDGSAPGEHLAANASLYAGILAVKGTPILAVFTVAGLAVAARRWRQDRFARWLLVTLAGYAALLMVLPLRQYFYLMSVWPLIAALQGIALGGLCQRLWGFAAAGKATALAVVCSLAVYLGGELRTAWPDLNLYGYHLTGKTWLGRESRGYRNLIQTPCDGLAEAVRWCEENLPAGATVVSYAWADHVLDHLIPADSRLHYVRRRAIENRRRGPDIAQADALLLHINNIVEYGDAPDAQEIRKLFGERPAFAVRRAYGIEIAWVYWKRSGAGATAHEDSSPQ